MEANQEKKRLVRQDSMEEIQLIDRNGAENVIPTGADNGSVQSSGNNVTVITIGGEEESPNERRRESVNKSTPDATPASSETRKEFVTTISIEQDTVDTTPKHVEPAEEPTVSVPAAQSPAVSPPAALSLAVSENGRSPPGAQGGSRQMETQFSHESTHTPLDICVYLMSYEGVLLKVEDGEHVTAAELYEMMLEELELSETAAPIFSLWMVSPLLAIQLKPQNVPYKLNLQWQELIEKYTNEDQDTQDEPIIRFQRSVYFPRGEELKVEDERVLKLLFEEAVYNVVNERYPCEDGKYDVLAGYQTVAQLGKYSVLQATDTFYKRKECSVKLFYPSHKLGGWNFFKSPKKRVQTCHEQMSNVLGPEATLKQVYTKYLEECWKLPYYGTAFFPARIEKPKSSIPVRLSSEKDVSVAINRDGVFVLDADKLTLLLGVEYEELRWAYKPAEDVDLLLLQFAQKQPGQDQVVFKLLKIRSRQARLMDALIQSCVDLMIQPVSSDGGGDYKPATPTESKEMIFKSMKLETGSVVCNKLQKLCLSTYNENGDCVDGNRMP